MRSMFRVGGSVGHATCALFLSLTAGCGAPVDSEGMAEVGLAATATAPAPSQAPERQIPNLCPFCPRTWTLVSGATPTGLAVTSSAVFWSGGTGSPGNWQIGIFTAPIGGGTPTQIYSAPTLDTPDSLVAAGSSLYFQQPGINAGTWTLPQSGGTAVKLTSISDLGEQRQGVAGQQSRSAGPLFFTFTTIVSGDPSNSHLWKFAWSTLSPHWGTTTLLDFDRMDNLGLYYPDNVTTDSKNAYFVAGRYSGSSTNAVYQMSLSGGTPLLLGMANYQSPIATNGTNVYFVSGNSILTVPIGGGTQATFAIDGGQPTTFAVDAGTLYWTCTSCGTVTKQSFGGGAATTIAAGEHAPEFLATDATNVYWGVTGAIRYHAK